MTRSSRLAASTINTNLFRSVVSLLALLMLLPLMAAAQTTPGPGQVGKWQILPDLSPINPVHAAVMHDGTVLMIEGKNTNPPVGVIWDPSVKKATRTIDLTYTMFCNGMVVLPDGRPFVMGGTLQFGSPTLPFTGQPLSSAYDLSTFTFTDQAMMADGRWYPTGTVLDDGTVLVFSGQDEGNGDTNNTVEIFTANSMKGAWSNPVTANFTPPLYPRLHLMPDSSATPKRRIFYSGFGSDETSRFYDLNTKTWSTCCHTVSTKLRAYGTSVLFPLVPPNYTPKVIILGGGTFDNTTAATNTTETIDLSVSTPAWVSGPNMSEPRIQLNATMLPSGNILVTGGSEFNEDQLAGSQPSLNADLYHANKSDPLFNTFTSAGMNAVARLYHSNAILLPDATVILTGSNPNGSPYEKRIELYQPAYLFDASGNLVTRPVINSVSPTVFGYDAKFSVTTDTTDITSMVLIRPAGVTHAFNMEQRLVHLSFAPTAAGSKTFTVTSPPNGTIAPPGYYMLFVLTSAGVPSVARFVQICPASGCL